MLGKKASLLFKNAPICLFSLIILTTSGCLLKKEVIPEYFPETPAKLEPRQMHTEAKDSSELEQALSEIKATTKEEPLLSSKATRQMQKKETPTKENLAKSTEKPKTKTQTKASAQVKAKKHPKKETLPKNAHKTETIQEKRVDTN